MFFNMDVERLNIYKRLRDFKVPSTVLDNIFSEENDIKILENAFSALVEDCLLYTSPSPRDGLLSRMPSSA